MDNNTRYFLLREIQKIKARERLEFMYDMGVLHGDPSDVNVIQHKIGLANIAFMDDEQHRADAIEAFSRKSN